MKPFTVQNTRNRRAIQLHGVHLAPPYSKGKSTMDLTLEELLDPQCVRLFKVGRLQLIRGEMPEELGQALLDVVEREGKDIVDGIHFEVKPEIVPEPLGVDTSMRPVETKDEKEARILLQDEPTLENVVDDIATFVEEKLRASPEEEEVVVLPEEEVLVVEEEVPMDRIDDERSAELEGEELAEDSGLHTYESLKEFTVSRLRKLAKSLKIKSSGSEDELIQRILDHQNGGS